MTFPKLTLSLSIACGLLAATAGTPALASSGMGVIGMPDRAEREPSAAAATRVRLNGVFSVGAGGVDPCYTEPQCGTLYYACPPGNEEICRMEWQEIANAAAAGKCVTFGSTRTETGTPQNNGRIRPAGQALGEPDPYPIGIGVREVGCARQDLSCGSTPDLVAARAQKCAGAAPGDGGAGATGGTAGGGGTAGQGGTITGSGGSTAGTGGADGGTAAERDSKSGCEVAGGGTGAAGGLLMLLLGVVTMTRVARRRGGRSGRSG